MKILRTLGVIALALLALALIIPLFMPDNSVIESSTKIDAHEATVFRQVNNYKNWQNWSPFEADSSMINTYEGPEQGVGCIRHWTAVEAGDGTMEILESKPYSYIKNKLEFGGKGGGVGEWSFSKSGSSIVVDWKITVTNLTYPFERLMSPIIGILLKPMLDKGLEDLKKYSESLEKPIEVKMIDLGTINALAIYDSVSIDGMSEMIFDNFEAIISYVKSKQYSISGAPFAVYHNWNPNGYTRISAAIPIEGKFKGHKNIKELNIESGKALFVKDIGGNTLGAHLAIDDYMKDHNLSTRDYIWEVYVSNQRTDIDTANWITDIYYPLK